VDRPATRLHFVRNRRNETRSSSFLFNSTTPSILCVKQRTQLSCQHRTQLSRQHETKNDLIRRGNFFVELVMIRDSLLALKRTGTSSSFLVCLFPGGPVTNKSVANACVLLKYYECTYLGSGLVESPSHLNQRCHLFEGFRKKFIKCLSITCVSLCGNIEYKLVLIDTVTDSQSIIDDHTKTRTSW
jgi:hypothetical protein